MPPASTGSDKSSRNTVTRIDHTNRGILCSVMPGARMLKIVVMKLMAPSSDEAPARCSANSVKSTDAPGWNLIDESGGYSVQPGPDPSPENRPAMISTKAGTSSQKLMLFSRG